MIPKLIPKVIEPSPHKKPKATGPKTPEGKAAAARNALKHGLCALSPDNVVIPGEDPAEFEAFQDEFLNDLRPSEATERLLAERIVVAQWRLRRAARYEGQLMRASLATVRRQEVSNAKWREPTHEKIDPDEQAELEIPRAVSLCLAGKAHWHMVRYEGYIERGMFRAIKQLLALRESDISISRLSPLPRVFDPRTGYEYPGAQYHRARGEFTCPPPSPQAGTCEGMAPFAGAVSAASAAGCETNPFCENPSQGDTGPAVTGSVAGFAEPTCPPPAPQARTGEGMAPPEEPERPPNRRPRRPRRRTTSSPPASTAAA